MSVTKGLAWYRPTIFLAASLLLLGAAAAFGAVQLNQIISRQSRNETVAAICATLQRQQYDTLTQMIDPAPVPPVATKPFDPRAFQAALRALDQRQGVVNSCSWRPLELDEVSATYLFSLRRPHVSAPIGMMVALRHEPDNHWRISRQSPFTSTPV